jgi:hypothetical protein
MRSFSSFLPTLQIQGNKRLPSTQTVGWFTALGARFLVFGQILLMVQTAVRCTALELGSQHSTINLLHWLGASLRVALRTGAASARRFDNAATVTHNSEFA